MRRRTAIAAMSSSLLSISGCIGQFVGAENSETDTGPDNKSESTEIEPGTENVTSERSMDSGLEVPDLQVFNETENRVTAQLVVREEGKRQFSTKFSLPKDSDSGSVKDYEDIVESKSGSITIDVEDGPKQKYNYTNQENQSLRLHAEIYVDSIQFSETGP